jgi:hypothetical protein
MGGSMTRDYVVAGTATDGSQIRRFADANIQAQIDKVLATAPPGASAGVILYANGDEVRAGIFGRKETRTPGPLGWLLGPKTTWTYGGTVSYNYADKDLKGEAQVGIWFGK